MISSICHHLGGSVSSSSMVVFTMCLSFLPHACPRPCFASSYLLPCVAGLGWAGLGTTLDLSGWSTDGLSCIR